jgi:probable rRNA maturation factor
MKIEITNRQKLKRINLKNLNRQLKKVSSFLNLSSLEVSLVFCDNKFIKSLNRKYFKKSSATDVISFGLDDNLGEVVVSVEEAVKTAKKLKLKWPDEVLLYSVHGILHLIGYSDRTKKERQRMERKQEEILGEICRGDSM